MLPDKHIERRIVIGLIVSDYYIKEMAGVWEPEYLQSGSAQRLASWCLEYYQKYDKAPGKDIEGIYFQKLKANQLDNETAAEIEEDILPELSDEYDREQFNTAYLMDQTRQYFKERKLTIFAEQVKANIFGTIINLSHSGNGLYEGSANQILITQLYCEIIKDTL